jgi:hypothetical protein
MPLILGANTLSAGGYEVDNSLRFNRGSSDYLSRTPASSGNRRTWTFSTWVKRSSLTGNQDLITSGSALQVVSYIYFYTANGIFAFEEYTGGYQINIKSNAYLRDLSAWYNLIIAVDTTQGTASNRIKMYINGNQVTSLSATTYPSQNFECNINSNTLHNIGCEQNGTNCIDGYLAETVFIDGLQLGEDSFGEFDEDSSVWKPIDVSGLTFGTNGFYLDFENSGSLGADVSGNTNDWTVNNLTSIDQTTDTPTNNFATLNPLNVPASNQPTFSNGNLISTSSTAVNGSFGGSSSMSVSTGKWYIEAKAGAIVSSNVMNIGVTYDQAETARTNNDAKTNYEYTYNGSGNKSNNNIDSAYGDSYTTGDIIGIALDLDNSKIYFSKNGVFQNSGDPTSGATGTGAAFTVTSGQTYSFYQQDETGASANTSQFEFNFGNPPFAITTGNEDANGYGNFEYEVPPGYYSLCTNNLAEYG